MLFGFPFDRRGKTFIPHGTVLACKEPRFGMLMKLLKRYLAKGAACCST